MNSCSSCGHPFGDEVQYFCPECGQEVPGSESYGGDPGAGEYDYNADGASWEPPPPSPLARLEEVLSKVSVPVLAVVGQVGAAFRSVLDDPRLRSQLPGGSLTLLGLGLVALALLLSVIPVVPGVGFGALVVLPWAALVAVNEWRLISAPEAQEPGSRPVPPLPPALATLPRDTRHPGIAQTFALLICTYAVLMLGLGPISLVWMLAGAVLGYDQGWRYFSDRGEDTEGGPGPRLHRWVVAGVVLCTFALLLPWTRGTLQVPGLSGGDMPLSTHTLFTLLLLACSGVRHRGLSAFHPLLLILAAVWLMMWFMLNMSAYAVGPWFFLPGLLAVEAAIVRHLTLLRGGGNTVEQQEAASDLDLQG
ncbi:hypothetical protein ATI61_107360 [Archangium gephyra]|uniref:Zinc ribbon domain-containing protein n=1 Tax=Archangium gephyra TaxID=48 RepID=A0AAC8QI11_9BACT|nr:hypothetical protein [Archangium gephyra]AKJ07916.1 Hypothetical protein AA314_09542 [Archangium gephyra]REG29664.1 hypothetical protein ATI61_107360 [Archangium gephyra]